MYMCSGCGEDQVYKDTCISCDKSTEVPTEVWWVVWEHSEEMGSWEVDLEDVDRIVREENSKYESWDTGCNACVEVGEE